jgi:hypothetical protein
MFRLPCRPQRAILLLNKQHEDSYLADHPLLLHWLLAAGQEFAPFVKQSIL